MRRLLAAMLLAAPAAAMADPVLPAAVMVCDPSADVLRVVYRQLGRSEAAEQGAILFRDLITYTRRPDGDPDFIDGEREEDRSCQLSGGRVHAVFRPQPGNVNLQGLCGAVVGGRIEIRRNGKTLLPDTPFEEKLCEDGPVIDTITVKGRTGTVTVSRKAG